MAVKSQPWIAAAVLAAALAGCADRPTPAAPERLAAVAAHPPAVEHATVQGGGYTLTLYPGWARRAVVEDAGGTVRELYRAEGAYRLPAGESAPGTRHEIRLRGGEHGRDLSLGVEDPMHQVAGIQLHLYGRGHTPGRDDRPVERITLLNNGETCPPACEGASSTLSTTPLVPEGSGTLPAAAEHRTIGAAGYELTLYPGFSRGADARVHGGEPVELWRQSGTYRLPAGESAPAARHRIRLRGGPYGRDLTLHVRDPLHHVAALVVTLYAPGHVPGAGAGGEPVETITIQNTANTCPPECEAS